MQKSPGYDGCVEHIDDVDAALIAALQHAPRAPVGGLAEVLGASASTVSRRLAGLRGRGVMRVSASVSWSLRRTGHPVFAWISCEPGSVRTVAAALSALPGMQSVFVLAGSADIQCLAHPTQDMDAAALVLDVMPQIAGVARVESTLILATSTRSSEWRAPGLLTEAQTAQLPALRRASEPAAPAGGEGRGPHELRPIELRVANLLVQDGRMSVNDIAAALEVTRTTARRALEGVLTSGLVRPRVDVEPRFLGFPLGFSASIRSRPSALAELLEELAGNVHARMVAMTAGSSSLVVQGNVRDEAGLRSFISDDLGAHPGITDLSVSVVLQTVKRNWRPISPEGLTEATDLRLPE